MYNFLSNVFERGACASSLSRARPKKKAVRFLFGLRQEHDTQFFIYWPASYPGQFALTEIPEEAWWPGKNDKKSPTAAKKTGAPNENVVQNHLTIALLYVFSIKTVDVGIFLSPKNFSSVRISYLKV